MGPAVVGTMVQEGIGDTSSKKLHPFFTKSDAPPELPIDPSADSQTSATDHPTAETSSEESRKKRRKTDTSLPTDDSEPKRTRRKRRNVGKSLNGAILNHLTKLDLDAPAATIPTDDEHAHKFPTPPLGDVPAGLSKGDVQAIIDHSDPVPPRTPNLAQPKKVLKFNPKTGTLGSPPKPKPISKPSRIVSIKYGRDDQHRRDVADKITRILEGSVEPPLQTHKKQRPPRDAESDKIKTEPPNKSDPLKATHPFFASKARPPSEAGKSTDPIKKPSTDRHTVFTSTPVSPRKPRNPFAPAKAVQFGIRSNGAKLSGAMHPLWPAQGTAHVRAGDQISCSRAARSDLEGRSRKSKGTVTTVVSRESVLQHLMERMDLTTVRNSLSIDADNFMPAPSELRLPRRHFESGRKVQKRIRRQLQTRFLAAYGECDLSADELSGQQPPKPHPAIDRLYKSLATQLSAFDRSCCENLSWAQKYAPTTAVQVLQTGKESLLLSQWLRALRVQSVETGGSDGDKGKSKSEGAPKKKRRKNKLEGFVVGSDEEADEMDEIFDDDWTPSPGYGLLKKSVIRSGDVGVKGSKDQGRLTNAIILSGPHGCGKTAVVYAVAKELDFEVFEINSSSRRSGKDILEKVGDMTRNHLVQQSRVESTLVDDADEVASEIKSGKQGMMTSFFKPKAATVQGKKQQKQTTKNDTEKDAKASQPKSQKQSLILLEEVDILFEEDKQFWATLVGLIVQSKRPFIMTCTDESLVPIQSLSLYGIFRFSPAPSSLAVDLCILIAANEGHALQRSAVEALYCSRNNDLRATITELNYWCQIGVGDRKGGFDWFVLRWPRGSDLDANGDVLRVISEDTYQKGMGWVGRDAMVAAPDFLDAEEESLVQAWDFWRLDMGDWCRTIDMEAWATGESESGASSTGSATLAACDEFYSAMSDADLCSSGLYGTKLQEVIDPSLPELLNREDFILGQTLLDADPIIRQVSLNKYISTSLKSLARAAFDKRSSSSSSSNPALGSVDEERAISMLDSSFRTCPQQLTRYDVALAFDPIAESPRGAATTHLDPSVFDRTLKLIVLDIAPWVRGIVAYEHRLMQRRLKLSNLMSEGGGGGGKGRKRMRTTRSAMSALEGGERRTTRRERHFGDALKTAQVMRTGGEAWADAVMKPEAEENAAAPGSPLSDDLS